MDKIDIKRIHKIYDEWPDIANQNYESDLEEMNYDNIKHIIFSGMGGSGTLGDVFSSILSKTDIHVQVIKGYTLPKTVNSETLVVITSVSGNTKETLSTLKSAKDENCKIISFSSGGELEKYSLKNNIEHRNIPMIHSPRGSFTAYLYSILKVLNNTIPIKNKEIKKSILQLQQTQKNISSNNLNDSNESLRLAKWLSGIPLIYYPFGLKAAAVRFKNSLQENTKIHAITEDLIESSHNGIVAWERKSEIRPILVEGKDDHIKTKDRWSILKEYFEINKIDFIEVNSVQGDILSKIINLIYVLDYSTIYRAILSNIDPSPVKSIDFVKSRVNSN